MTSSLKNRPLVNRLVSAQLDITATQKWTLVCLLDHQNKKNGTKVWPSIERLVAMVGHSESTVRRALQDLSEVGFVTIEYQPGATNLYYLNLEMIEEYLRHSDTPTSSTPVTVTPHPLHNDTPPLSPRQGTPVTMTPEQSKEPVREQSNLTGSEKSNRQKGKAEDFKTARSACLGAISMIGESKI
jgi:predicted transcriptional regulator